MLNQSALLNELVFVLQENKALDTITLDVRDQTSVTDYMIITTARSARHVKAIAEYAKEHMKKHQLRALGTHGLEDAQWVLVDFGDFILHIMQPESRDFYQIEDLWQQPHA